MPTNSYRYMANYPGEVAAADDRRVPVAPGDFVDNVDLENEDNKVLLNNGLLIANDKLVDTSAASNKENIESTTPKSNTNPGSSA